MKIKFDDGEHANTVPGDLLKNNVPELGDLIQWDSEPENEDDLARGRYRVFLVEWRLGGESEPLVTIHLEAVA